MRGLTRRVVAGTYVTLRVRRLAQERSASDTSRHLPTPEGCQSPTGPLRGFQTLSDATGGEGMGGEAAARVHEVRVIRQRIGAGEQASIAAMSLAALRDRRSGASLCLE